MRVCVYGDSGGNERRGVGARGVGGQREDEDQSAE